MAFLAILWGIFLFLASAFGAYYISSMITESTVLGFFLWLILTGLIWRTISFVVAIIFVGIMALFDK